MILCMYTYYIYKRARSIPPTNRRNDDIINFLSASRSERSGRIPAAECFPSRGRRARRTPCTRIYTHTHTHNIYAHICVCVCVSVSVCLCVCVYLQLVRDDTTRSAARRHPLTSASVRSHGPQRGAHARFYILFFYFPLKFSRVSLGERHHPSHRRHIQNNKNKY